MRAGLPRVIDVPVDVGGSPCSTRSPRSSRLVRERASDALDRRGAVVILSARYVPLGRVAVNLTAGATGFPPRRFVGLAAVAATTWAAWSVGVGALAGHWLEGNPLLGSVLGVVAALLLGLGIDRVARRASGWGRMPSAVVART